MAAGYRGRSSARKPDAAVAGGRRHSTGARADPGATGADDAIPFRYARPSGRGGPTP